VECGSRAAAVELESDSYTPNAGARLPHSIQDQPERKISPQRAQRRRDGREERFLTALGMTAVRLWLVEYSAGRGIGDFSEDGGIAGAGGGGKIGGAVMESFVGQDGEGESFLSVGGDVEI